MLTNMKPFIGEEGSIFKVQASLIQRPGESACSNVNKVCSIWDIIIRMSFSSTLTVEDLLLVVHELVVGADTQHVDQHLCD